MNSFNRTRSIPQLSCEGRFYRGYNMKLGDFGNVILSQTKSSDLCLFKFYPASNCKIRFSCDSFSVSPGYSSSSCPSKMLTKPDTSPAEKWCGDKSPPSRSAPLVTTSALLVGYMSVYPRLSSALSQTQIGRDRFRCTVGCVRLNSGGGGATSGGGGRVNCRCGQVNISRKTKRVMKRKKRRKITRKSGLKEVFGVKKLNGISRVGRSSDLTRIIGGVAASPGSVPWQASLAVSGIILSVTPFSICYVSTQGATSSVERVW